MTEVEKLLTDYLDYLEIEKNRSPKTRRNYEHYLSVFFKQAGIKSYKDITAESVRAFRIYLARQKVGRSGHPSASSGQEGELMKKVSQNYYVIAIRNFLKFLIKRDYQVLAPDKIELPKLPTRQIEIIEYNDLERLLKAPEGSDLRSLRDRAILEMLFSTGLRISELCGLSRYIDLTRDELTVRGKGEKLRVVFLSDTCKSALKAYLAKRTDALEWLFVSLTKTPAASAKAPARQAKVIGKITTRAVQRLVNFYARKAGITRHLTPHGLRHLFATDLLINGADIRSVQEMLGHSNIATTQIYTHLTNKQLKDIHKTFHGKRRD